MRFALSQCRMPLQYWSGSKPNFVLAREELGIWIVCFSLGGGIFGEVTSSTKKARLALTNFSDISETFLYRTNVGFA